MFGGYMQLRSTAASLDVDSFFSSDEESSQCYELSVQAEAGFAGFRAGAEASASGCTEEALSQFNSLRQSFQSSTREQSIIGGGISDGEFVVPADKSTLLTTRDKYPDGDKGMEIRLLSDFLEPSRISPLEFRRSQITERQFEAMRESLQTHIIESLQDKASILGECGDCEVPYLEQNENGQFECKCHDPKAAGLSIKNVRMRSGDHWGLSSTESIKPSIIAGGKPYYPYGENEHRAVNQNSWYDFGNFAIDNLEAGELVLNMHVESYGNYEWRLPADEWFKPQTKFQTSGKDTNNNKQFLMWEFDVVRS